MVEGERLGRMFSAKRTKERAASAAFACRNRCLATWARLVLFAVDCEADGKVAWVAAEITIVTKRCAARGDGLLQNFFDGTCQTLVVGTGEFSCGSKGVKACRVQTFGGIDIADADDDVGLHEEIFDRHASLPALFPQIASELLMTQRLDSERLQPRVLVLCGERGKATEATGVDEL